MTALTQNEEIPIVVTTTFDDDSFVKRYHEYQNIWTSNIGEILSIEREPGNLVDKYVVWVKKENETVGHLSKDGKFAKTSFFVTEYYTSDSADGSRHNKMGQGPLQDSISEADTALSRF